MSASNLLGYIFTQNWYVHIHEMLVSVTLKAQNESECILKGPKQCFTGKTVLYRKLCIARGCTYSCQYRMLGA